MDITDSLKHTSMKKTKIFAIMACMVMLISIACQKSMQYRALIVTGQNTTNWKVSTPVIKQILEQTGLFRVDIAISPEKGGDMKSFKPSFGKYNVVVLNYSGDSWSEDTKKAFVNYVSDGGGVVVYHSASSAFPGWKEYEEICGLTGWGGRSEINGPYIYFKDGRMVIDSTPGQAGWYGKTREFEVRTRNMEHPVMKGLPVRWMHGSDLLYARMRGPAKNLEVLATAFCDTSGNGTGRHEPVMMTINYGKGRVFHTTLGYPEGEESPALKCAGFITTFQRGTEWAASGNVTQSIPPDFPSAAGVSIRKDYKYLSLEENIAGLVNYDIGKSTKCYTGLQEYIRRAAGDKEKLLEIEKLMTGVLNNSSATVEAKKLVLRELSWMGTDYCIPAIRNLQSVPELKDEVSFALERLGIK